MANYANPNMGPLQQQIPGMLVQQLLLQFLADAV